MSFKTWESFEKLLYKLSEQPGYKPIRGDRTPGSPLISPAIFKENCLRLNDNVLHWGGWVALDIDDYSGHWEDALSVFSQYQYVCYSSASSTVEKPKFRIVLPCLSYIPHDKIKHLWYALNKHFNSLGDPQTKDLSRMYYVPAKYPNSFHFIRSNPGKRIDWESLLTLYPFVLPHKPNSFVHSLPDEIRNKIAEYKKGNLCNTSYRWDGYRDCKFVNKNLVAQYISIGETGWYKKMYSIMMSIATLAIRNGYPITPLQIANLCREIDAETGGWYKNRNMETEAARAITFAVSNL